MTKTHRLTNTKEYGIWAAIRTRCTNPNSVGYAKCGGSGITMPQAWMDSFECFIADVGTRPSDGFRLERLDRTKPYSKDNVVWRKWTGIKKHGLSESKIYRLWHGMKERCYDKNHVAYHRYGGIGITVCEQWHSFQAFFEDMGHPPSAKHSLDRKDNSGPYSPDNCKWATDEEQANNKRNSRRITHNGETKTLAQWSRIFGIRYSLLHKRLMQGWHFADAVAVPSGGPRPRHPDNSDT